MSNRLEDYDFALPEHLIAQEPLANRDTCRLMVIDRKSGELQHSRFDQIGAFLRPGDMVVLNDTRVIPARLRALGKNGRGFEVMLLAPRKGELDRECMVRPAAKLVKENFELQFPEGVSGKFERLDDYLCAVKFSGLTEGEFPLWLDRNGSLPLPPYIRRSASEQDRDKYQTVFAEKLGSVAAPTAGLHFTPELLSTLTDHKIQVARVTLHVGYGTFSPIRTDDLNQHRMHSESYEVSPEVWEKIRKTKEQGGRVIACGTTVVRTLESVGKKGLSSSTDLFIQPGYSFEVVDGLITNFHLPKSSLLVLVSAFAGRERMLSAYAEAAEKEYRFFSYGDAMIIL